MCILKGLRTVTMTGCNPFFTLYYTISPSMLPVLYWETVFLALSPLSSILIKVAAIAASLSPTASARRKGGVGAALPTFPASPFPLFSSTAERSNGQRSLTILHSSEHRFFPAPKLIGVNVGALRLRMVGLEKTEKLKIVQSCNTSVVQVCPHVQSPIVSHDIATPFDSYLKKNLLKSYAVSLNWQCALPSSDYTLEVAA